MFPVQHTFQVTLFSCFLTLCFISLRWYVCLFSFVDLVCITGLDQFYTWPCLGSPLPYGLVGVRSFSPLQSLCVALWRFGQYFTLASPPFLGGPLSRGTSQDVTEASSSSYLRVGLAFQPNHSKGLYCYCSFPARWSSFSAKPQQRSSCYLQVGLAFQRNLTLRLQLPLQFTCALVQLFSKTISNVQQLPAGWSSF